jgi:DNA mismatch endonuclease (patch repair protein)
MLSTSTGSAFSAHTLIRVRDMTYPHPSSPSATATMKSNRRRDTTPELALRSALHRLGLRFRVDSAPLPDLARRRADIVFRRAQVAVFVDGCFWHGCPAHGTVPRSNAGYWVPKLHRNRERDAETDAALEMAGWLPIHVWGHDDPQEAATRIKAEVTSRLTHRASYARFRQQKRRPTQFATRMRQTRPGPR